MPHKVDELRRILGAALAGVELVTYDGPEPVEDGDTFEANALIKARAAAEHTGLAGPRRRLGHLRRRPRRCAGIFSARWAGTRDGGDNLELLLAQLSDIADPHRGAHFTCAIAIVAPEPQGDRASRRSRRASGRGDWPLRHPVPTVSATTRSSCRTATT